MNTTDRPTLGVAETAELLGVSRGLVQPAVRDGSLPSRRIGRRILIPTARLDAWLQGEPRHGDPAGQSDAAPAAEAAAARPAHVRAVRRRGTARYCRHPTGRAAAADPPEPGVGTPRSVPRCARLPARRGRCRDSTRGRAPRRAPPGAAGHEPAGHTGPEPRTFQR